MARRRIKQNTRVIAANQNDFIFARSFWEDWRNRTKESIQFFRGVQWTQKEGAFLSQRKREALVFNKILQHVDAMTGSQRQNRFRTLVKPVERDDVVKAQLMQKVLDHIKHSNDYEFVESRVFEDAAIGGVGWFHYDLDFTDFKNGEEGKIVITQENPLNILLDPNSQRFDIKDAQFVIKTVWLTREQTIQKYPDQKQLINNSIFAEPDTPENEKLKQDRDDTSGVNNLLINARRDPRFVDSVNRTVRIIEKWWIKTETTQIAYDPDSNESAVAPKSKADRDALLEEIPNVVFFLSANRIVQITTTAHDFQLVDQKADIQLGKLPFVPLFFYKKDREVWGLIENLKDYNREINKRRSSILLGLNKQVNYGWIAKENAIDEDQWRTNPDIRYVKGDLNNVREVNVATMPSGYFAYDKYINEDMQEVGVSQSARGIQESANESGRLFQAKVAQSALKQQGFFDNWRFAARTLAEDLINAAQQVMTDGRRLRILGDEGDPEFFEINTSEFNDITIGQFDIRIDEGAVSTTNREMENFLLTELFRLMVEGGVPSQTLPWHLVVEGSGHPKAREIADFLQQGQQAQGQVPGIPGASPQIGGPGGNIAPVQIPEQAPVPAG